MAAWGTRHSIVVLCFLMGALKYSLRFNLSIGIVAMVSERAPVELKKGAISSSPYHPPEICPPLELDLGSIRNLNVSVPVSLALPEDLRASDNTTSPELELVPGGIKNIKTFNWNEKDQGLVLGSFYWGYILSQFPSGLLAQKYGGKWIIAVSMLAAGTLSVALPHAAMFGGRDYVIAVRALQGFAEGFVVPSLVNIKAKWFPPEERGHLSTICAAGFPFGTAVAMLISGQVIPTYGWPFVFYIPGVLTILYFFIWIMMAHSSPEDHPTITEGELKYIRSSIRSKSKSDLELDSDYIEAGNTIINKENNEISLRAVPWKAIACSIPVWAILFSQFCNALGHNMIQDVGPKYLHSVLQFDIHANSYVAASPYLAQMIFSIAFARLSDFLLQRRLISMLTGRRLCNSVGQWGLAIFFAGIIVAGCNRVPAVAFYVLSGMINGAMLGGSYVNSIDISPSYAGLIEGVINSISHLNGFGAPYIAGLILYHEPSILGWRFVFMMPMISNLIGNLIFLVGAKAEVQGWDPKATAK